MYILIIIVALVGLIFVYGGLQFWQFQRQIIKEIKKGPYYRVNLNTGIQHGPFIKDENGQEKLISEPEAEHAHRETEKDMQPAKLTKRGDLECPECKVHIITPIQWNPYNGLNEPFQLCAGRSQCPWCGLFFTVDESVAKAHNKFHFKD